MFEMIPKSFRKHCVRLRLLHVALIKCVSNNSENSRELNLEVIIVVNYWRERISREILLRSITRADRQSMRDRKETNEKFTRHKRPESPENGGKFT